MGRYFIANIIGAFIGSLLVTYLYLFSFWGIGMTETRTVENFNPQERTDTTQFFRFISDKKEIDTLRQKRTKKVKRVFGYYNENISDSTVSTFLDVCEHYELIDNERSLNIYIGQICIESGAKQTFRDGTVVKSSGNAIGISQIVPTTAFYYLKYHMPENEKKKLKEEGVNTEFIKDYELKTVRINKDSTITYAAGEGRQKVIEWLKDEKNNLYLWGYIMKRNLERFDMNSTLVAYNEGPHSLKRIKHPSRHIYVKKIRGVIYRRIKGDNELALN